MKLRLRNNTLRIRFGTSEVETLADGGTVESVTPFGPDQALVCRVVPSGQAPLASFEESVVSLQVPASSLRDWASGSELTLEHEQVWPGGSLRISLEKDLACTHPRKGEDDSDAFPNPLQK